MIAWLGVWLLYLGNWKEGEKEKVAFLGDLVPLAQHVQLLWVSAYDVQPDQSVEAKAQLLEMLRKENYRILLDHQVEGFYGEIHVDEKGRYKFKALDINPVEV